MKRKFLLIGTLITLLVGVLGVFLTLNHAPGGVHAAGSNVVTPIFSDNFDTYTPGPLPTGTGTNQWTSVKVKGTTFGVQVTNSISHSTPNSLQFVMGSDAKGHAYAEKTYSTSYTLHAVAFNVYLDPTLTYTKQGIPLMTAENSASPFVGSASVWLSVSHVLQVVWYDAGGVKHSNSTPKSTALKTGVWYHIELDQNFGTGASSGSWKLYNNGVKVLYRTNIGTGPVDTIIAGDNLSSVAPMSGSFYEDDVETASVAFIG